MNKSVYIVRSLHVMAPTYRLYDYYKAQDLLLAVRKEWPDHEFWLDKKQVIYQNCSEDKKNDL